MTKKLSFLVLSAFLILTFLAPLSFGSGVTAASTYYELTENLDFAADTPSVQSLDTSGNGWSWDRDNQTLTLNNVRLDLSDHIISIEAAVVVPAGATIQLDGDNLIYNSADSSTYLWRGIYSRSLLPFIDSYESEPLIITGSGKMTIQNAEIGIASDSGLLISETNIQINTREDERNSYAGISSYRGDLKIANSTVDIFNCNVAITDRFASVFEAGAEDSPDQAAVQKIFNPYGIIIDNSTLNLISVYQPGYLGISSMGGYIQIDDSTVYVDGYDSGIMIDGYYDKFAVENDSPEISKDITIKNCQIELSNNSDFIYDKELNSSSFTQEKLDTNISFYRGYSAAISTTTGSIFVSDSQLDIQNYMFGLVVGMDMRMRSLADIIDSVPVSEIILENCAIDITGIEDLADNEMANAGIVNLAGPISISNCDISINECVIGIINRLWPDSSDYPITIEFSDIKITNTNAYTPATDPVFWIASLKIITLDPSDVSTAADNSGIILDQSYIKIPAGGQIERVNDGDTSINVSIDQIAPDENGIVHIARYPTVTFASNGGSSIDPQIVAPGDFVIKPQDPEMNRFTFGGWYQDMELQNAWDFTSDTVNQDMVLYAGWARVPVQIDYVEQDNSTGIQIDGLQRAVLLPEADDPDVDRIVLSINVTEIDLDASELQEIINNLQAEDYSLIGLFDITLIKTIYKSSGDQTTVIVDNDDITDALTIRIPIPDDYLDADNLAIAYIAADGSITVIKAEKVIIDGLSYLQFAADHFSDYAMVQAIEMDDEDMDDDGRIPIPETGRRSSALPYLLLASVSGLFLLLKRKQLTQHS